MTRAIAIVVGAGGSFGRAIVSEFVAEGLKVVAVGRTSTTLESLIDKHGDAVSTCTTDIGSDSSIAAIGAMLDAPVAAVVQSVGLPVAGGVVDADISAIALACNLKCGGFLRLIRAAEPHLRSGSRLIAIGGHYGFEPSPYAMTAGVANAALANIVRQVSLAYGHYGYTAHLIAPGPADTDRLRRVAAHRARSKGCDLEDELEAMKAESAIGAFTTPGQVAWMVRTLLAPEADALAGSALGLDAGRRKGIC